MNHVMRSLAVLATAAVMAGCATTNSHDPFETYNRAVFEFNDKLDQAVLKPTATVYRDAAPYFVQVGVGNFFENLNDVWTGTNNFLQGKFEDGVNDFMRFSVNSTLGILGFIDIASPAGIPKHKQDFGTTLGVWGVPSGPYVVLPLMGPSTVRDTAALPVDFQGDPWSYVDPARTRYAGSAIRLVDKRAAALDAFNLIEEAALDRYEFIRDAFMQRRQSKINQSRERNDDAPAEDKDLPGLQSIDQSVKNSYLNAAVRPEQTTQPIVVLESNSTSQPEASVLASFDTDGSKKPSEFLSIVTLHAEAAESSFEAIAY